jgi:hypothetical protein
MYEECPEKEWFVIANDDNYINIPMLEENLFPFDFDAELCFGEVVKGSQLNGRERTEPSGGASIVASRGMVKRLFPTLEDNSEYGRHNFGAHDLAWGAILEKETGKTVDQFPGLLGQPLLFYLMFKFGQAQAKVRTSKILPFEDVHFFLSRLYD